MSPQRPRYLPQIRSQEFKKKKEKKTLLHGSSPCLRRKSVCGSARHAGVGLLLGEAEGNREFVGGGGWGGGWEAG